MSAYKRLYNSDVVSTPYVANKLWSFGVCDLSQFGIKVYNGVKSTSSIFDYENDIKTNNQYDVLMYDSINHIYYQEFSGSYLNNIPNLYSNNYENASIYRPSASYFEYGPDAYMVKRFPTGSGDQIKVLSISKDVFGDSIKGQSFSLSSSYVDLKDDGKGNIYDQATNPATLVGNIFYGHGVVVVTNQDYQDIFPIPPYAADDSYIIRVSESPYTFYPLVNDDGKQWTLLTASIELSGSDAQYFSTGSGGSVIFNRNVPGLYKTTYRVASTNQSSSCVQHSNYADIRVAVKVPLCDFQVFVEQGSVNVLPSPSPSPTPSVTPSISVSPSVTPTVTPSISVSPSVTPSISISPSLTPSISISRTPSVTPSISPSVTPSISISPSRTPSVTPSPVPTYQVTLYLSQQSGTAQTTYIYSQLGSGSLEPVGAYTPGVCNSANLVAYINNVPSGTVLKVGLRDGVFLNNIKYAAAAGNPCGTPTFPYCITTTMYSVTVTSNTTIYLESEGSGNVTC